MDTNNTSIGEVQIAAAPVTEPQTTPEPSTDPSDTLAMINALKEDSPEAPATEAPKAKETPAQPAEEDPEKAAEEKRMEILRQIAMNPNASQQYAQHYQPPQFYQQPQPQTQQQQYPPSLFPFNEPLDANQAALPFDEDTFDPTDVSHMQALVASQVEQVGQPLYEMLEGIQKHFTSAEQTLQQQQEMEAIQHANDTAVNLLDTYVPGFSGIPEKLQNGTQLSVQEEALFNIAANLEDQYMRAYPQAGHDAALRAQIIQQIGPIIKEKATQLGMVSHASTPAVTPEQKQQYAREMYVESSNHVPVSTVAQFDKAHQSNDLLGMILAL